MQRYLFFFNNRFILFTESPIGIQDAENKSNQIIDLQTVSNFNYKDFFANAEAKNLILILSKNKIRDLKFFLTHFRIIKAAGGIVQNPKKEFLLIFRNGVWDLPKGKAESGENIRKAAIREVEEESGLENLKIISFQTKTYHIYKIGEELILKKTYWYNMSIKNYQIPVPQAEEGISKAEWITAEMLKERLQNAYSNIRLLLEQHADLTMNDDV